jgi:hypothetical protein
MEKAMKRQPREASLVRDLPTVVRSYHSTYTELDTGTLRAIVRQTSRSISEAELQTHFDVDS